MAKMKDSRVAWIVGGFVALGALIGGVAYAASSKSTTSGGGGTNPPNPPPPGVTPISYPPTLKKGRRYGVQATGPVGSLATLPGTTALLQAALDSGQPILGVAFQAGLIKVISVSASPDASKWACVFDDIGSDITVPPVPPATQAQAQQMGVTINVTDIGVAGSP